MTSLIYVGFVFNIPNTNLNVGAVLWYHECCETRAAYTCILKATYI